jgi:hypothetical protein
MDAGATDAKRPGAAFGGVHLFIGQADAGRLRAVTRGDMDPAHLLHAQFFGLAQEIRGGLVEKLQRLAVLINTRIVNHDMAPPGDTAGGDQIGQRSVNQLEQLLAQGARAKA